MKKAVLLHGTDGNPEDNWFPWLKKLLEENGVKTYIPHLPDNHTPNRFIYEKFLQASGWDFNKNLLIGHSSGSTTVLNLLQSQWFPNVDTVVMVGTFLNERLLRDVEWYTPGQFNNLFPGSFNIEKIKSKANKFYFLHSEDDPYCDFDDAKDFCEQVGGIFISVPDGKHLSSNRVELPEMIPALKESDYL